MINTLILYKIYNNNNNTLGIGKIERENRQKHICRWHIDVMEG